MQTPEFGGCAGRNSDVGAVSRRHRRLAAVREEFPPPISWLEAAEDEDLPSQIPWVMKRYSTSDGRLIINEERVKRHDYFLVDRSNGRLVLNLVHVDDAVVEAVDDDDKNRRSPQIDAGDEDVVSERYKYSGVAALKTCASGVFVATAPPLFMPPLHT